MRLHKNESGQMTLEMVLVAIMFISGALFVGNYMNQAKFMQAFTQGPWELLQGMTQSGVWAPPVRARENHPNMFKRVGTVDADKVP